MNLEDDISLSQSEKYILYNHDQVDQSEIIILEPHIEKLHIIYL